MTTRKEKTYWCIYTEKGSPAMCGYSGNRHGNQIAAFKTKGEAKYMAFDNETVRKVRIVEVD